MTTFLVVLALLTSPIWAYVLARLISWGIYRSRLQYEKQGGKTR